MTFSQLVFNSLNHPSILNVSKVLIVVLGSAQFMILMGVFFVISGFALAIKVSNGFIGFFYMVGLIINTALVFNPPVHNLGFESEMVTTISIILMTLFTGYLFKIARIYDYRHPYSRRQPHTTSVVYLVLCTWVVPAAWLFILGTAMAFYFMSAQVPDKSEIVLYKNYSTVFVMYLAVSVTIAWYYWDQSKDAIKDISIQAARLPLGVTELKCESLQK